MLEGTALGTVVELMVEAEILVGSDGRLIPSRVEPDVDHRDIVVAEVGGYGALWLQVKGTTHPDREGRIVAFANYPVDAIPESARLLYLVCLLDVDQHLLARTWLVPSSDFNRRAYREHARRQGVRGAQARARSTPRAAGPRPRPSDHGRAGRAARSNI